MKLSDLADRLQGKLVGTDREYTKINLDSRTIAPGDLFVAISGDRFDGHLFIEQALQRGASGALVEQTLVSNLSLIQVKNTRLALGTMAQHHRQRFLIPLIALTGSCGKTTTKEILRTILAESGPVLANISSFNNDIGVPLTLLNLTRAHRFAVIEMGANHLNEIHYLSGLAQPDVALVTNVAPAHLQGFGSLEKVAQAKAEIFSTLSEKGVAIINSDDQFASYWMHLKQDFPYRRVSFGVSTAADFLARNIRLDYQGRPSFLLITPYGQTIVHLKLPGQHQVMNALAATAAATQIGICLKDIKLGLEKSKSVSGRMVFSKAKTGAFIIDDSYNANPSSVAAALQLLAHYVGRRIFVMGDMAELGNEAVYYHQKMGKLARELKIDEVYTYGELSALTTEMFGSSGKHYATQKELIQALRPRLQEGVILLVKGSRRTQMEKIVLALNN